MLRAAATGALESSIPAEIVLLHTWSTYYTKPRGPPQKSLLDTTTKCYYRKPPDPSRSVCAKLCFVLLNQYEGIITVTGFPHRESMEHRNARTIENRHRGIRDKSTLRTLLILHLLQSNFTEGATISKVKRQAIDRVKARVDYSPRTNLFQKT